MVVRRKDKHKKIGYCFNKGDWNAKGIYSFFVCFLDVKMEMNENYFYEN